MTAGSGLRHSSARVAAAFGVILLGTALLRLLWLDRYPAGWHHDEALMGVMAGEVYRGEARPVFFPSIWVRSPCISTCRPG